MPYEDFAALPAPVRDFPEDVVGRWFRGAGGLRDSARRVTHNMASFVESCGPRDERALKTLTERLHETMPAAHSSAVSGAVLLDPGIPESLRLKQAQRIAAERRIDRLAAAAELQWDRYGRSATSRVKIDRALEDAEYNERLVDRIDQRLDQRRGTGHDASSWFASEAIDQAIRGCALHCVGREWERERAIDRGDARVALDRLERSSLSSLKSSEPPDVGLDW